MSPGETRVEHDPMRRLAPGARVAGRYRIVELCGVGGMGLVYRADDEELSLPVALKVLRPELSADPSLLDRFRRELVLGRQVSHPNVVRIHDIGQDGDLHFLTMDYVEGRSLRQWMEERGRMDEATAVSILRAVTEALAVAHRAGVIHRDLKPSNILIDASERPHVSDFGLARSLAASGLTRAGTVMGTPDYLSPEQARGEPVDARTDLYALGIIRSREGPWRKHSPSVSPVARAIPPTWASRCLQGCAPSCAAASRPPPRDASSRPRSCWRRSIARPGACGVRRSWPGPPSWRSRPLDCSSRRRGGRRPGRRAWRHVPLPWPSCHSRTRPAVRRWPG